MNKATSLSATLHVTSAPFPGTSDDGHFPLEMPREYEEALLKLSASRTLDPIRWMSAGPHPFMAGVAVMLASMDELDRKGLLALAERLHPGASEPAAFTQWLKRSPLRPSRFLPMLAMELQHPD